MNVGWGESGDLNPYQPCFTDLSIMCDRFSVFSLATTLMEILNSNFYLELRI
jgi:hypothetical protein